MTTTATRHNYYESELSFAGDPLAGAVLLARCGLHRSYVTYESGGQFFFASGALAEVTLDRHGIHVWDGGEAHEHWDGNPLPHLHKMLSDVADEGWRAYGWAAFELAYAMNGDTRTAGGQRLLHLMLPHTEVRIGPGQAWIRSADAETVETVTRALTGQVPHLKPRPRALDVRVHGSLAYQRSVEAAVRQIRAGLFEKIILSRVIPVEDEIDIPLTYACGRRGNNPARSFLLRLGGVEAAGFSPEIAVQVSDSGRVVSQPLAGTCALTSDTAENQRRRARLTTDAKEVYEHAISVKTACDELSEVCVPSSLNIEDFMTVKERGTVQHLGSRVAGQLQPGRLAWDAFAAVFPAVTASGIPKSAVYPAIRAHETKGRGLYGGTVLTVEESGAMDAALVLRAVFRENGSTWLRAGAGIVGQSSPQREFQETCEKLESVARFLVPANGSQGDG